MPIRNSGSGSSRDYKRGAVMGLTVAEAFILLSFILLLLFTWWQVDTEKRSLRLADSLGEMTDEQKAEVVSGLTDGTFDLARSLRAAGLSIQDQQAIEDTKKYSRFMREEDMKRLMNGAVELPPGTLLKLGEAVEITPETRLRAALEDLLKPGEAASTASQRLAEAAEAEEGLVAMLNRELGDDIRAAGGEIRSDGTIILPQNVLFDAGSDRIRNPQFLRDFCAPWVRTLKSSNLDIAELKIEGHASSEGQPGQDASRSYLYNLDLSQRRAQNALQVCLAGLNIPEVMDWARGRLSSTGYSSARLVTNEDGSENRQASRRVEFSMEMNREKLLDDIREDLGALEMPEASKAWPEPVPMERGRDTEAVPDTSSTARSTETDALGTRGVPRIVDGDTLVIDERRWRLSGIDAPEQGQTCLIPGQGVMPCGKVATAALVRLIGAGEVRCEEIEKDRYGRSVGTCYVGETDLAREMIKAGMARAYLKYSKAYKEEGEAAEAGKVGFWAGEFQDPTAFRRSN